MPVLGLLSKNVLAKTPKKFNIEVQHTDYYGNMEQFSIKCFDMKIQHTEVKIEIRRSNSNYCKIEIQHDKFDL